MARVDDVDERRKVYDVVAKVFIVMAAKKIRSESRRHILRAIPRLVVLAGICEHVRRETVSSSSVVVLLSAADV